MARANRVGAAPHDASGGFSVSLCQEKADTDESTRVAREWIAKNAGNKGVSAPTVTEGTVILQLKWTGFQLGHCRKGRGLAHQSSDWGPQTKCSYCVIDRR